MASANTSNKIYRSSGSSSGDGLQTSKTGPAGRRKVKSGCRTCKIRKIKCDEGRPSCSRCVSTGRVCDGYGIFGGGGKSCPPPVKAATSWGYATGHRYIPCTLLAMWNCTTTIEENSYYEWFRLQTSKKVPGIFHSDFWDKLVFQVTLDEPAVLHAVLALSSIQKREVYFDKVSQGEEAGPLDSQQVFMLRHYTKAIGHLQSHFTVQTRSSIRVALVACLIFICLENLRGHYKSAQTHLQSGLNLLEKLQIVDFADSYIVEEFSKLRVQVELLRLSYQHPCSVLHFSEVGLPTTVFVSTCDARQKMDHILNQIFHLTEEARSQSLPQFGTYSTDLRERQAVIISQLAAWLEIYNASQTNLQTHAVAKEKSLQAQLILRDKFAYGLLRIWHTFATISAAAALWPGCEWKFNSRTSDFISILVQSIALRQIVSETQKGIYGTGNETTHSIFHIGIMPALYYTAIKCRFHRVRLHAVRLLEATSHREGLWDAKIFACIARKVMEIEEGDFYSELEQDDKFPLFQTPEDCDLVHPALPDAYRLQEVEVILPESSSEPVQLLCRRRQDDGSWHTLVHEYDLIKKCWSA